MRNLVITKTSNPISFSKEIYGTTECAYPTSSTVPQAARFVVGRKTYIHSPEKNTCIRAGAFFVIEVSDIKEHHSVRVPALRVCNHPLFHIASAMPKEKATILKWSPPENTNTNRLHQNTKTSGTSAV